MSCGLQVAFRKQVIMGGRVIHFNPQICPNNCPSSGYVLGKFGSDLGGDKVPMRKCLKKPVQFSVPGFVPKSLSGLQVYSGRARSSRKINLI